MVSVCHLDSLHSSFQGHNDDLQSYNKGLLPSLCVLTSNVISSTSSWKHTDILSRIITALEQYYNKSEGVAGSSGPGSEETLIDRNMSLRLLLCLLKNPHVCTLVWQDMDALLGNRMVNVLLTMIKMDLAATSSVTGSKEDSKKEGNDCEEMLSTLPSHLTPAFVLLSELISWKGLSRVRNEENDTGLDENSKISAESAAGPVAAFLQEVTGSGAQGGNSTEWAKSAFDASITALIAIVNLSSKIDDNNDDEKNAKKRQREVLSELSLSVLLVITSLLKWQSLADIFIKRNYLSLVLQLPVHDIIGGKNGNKTKMESDLFRPTFSLIVRRCLETKIEVKLKIMRQIRGVFAKHKNRYI